MRKFFLFFAVIALAPIFALMESSADDGPKDPNKQFYSGNVLYEKGSYAKALEEYARVMDTGLGSPNLYYNIGNSFLKMGKTGYAILFYEKALRLMPQDSDLRSNLDYARSLIGAVSFRDARKDTVVGYLTAPFRGWSLGAAALSASILYLLTMVILMIALANPVLFRRLALFFIFITVLFLFNAAVFIYRYYDEDVLRHAIIVQKEAEAKYEPIDKSTTFYKLKEGDEVIVLKTKNEWRKVATADGKTGWIEKKAAEEI